MSTSMPIDMFDRVLLHEIAHAIMWETRLSELLSLVGVSEELLAWFLEAHAIEAVSVAMESLGRGVCVDGTCMGGHEWN